MCKNADGHLPRQSQTALMLMLILASISAANPPDRRTVSAITFSDVPPVTAGVTVVQSLPLDEKEKLGWITWIWDEQLQAHPGQTFRLTEDAELSAISVLFASAENIGQQRFTIEFEGYGDADADVRPTTEGLSLYRGIFPDQFDRQSPGKWVTFQLSRPMPIRRDRSYAFRLAFEQVKEYELRRAFIRATNVDQAGNPRSAVPGRMTHQAGPRHYFAWGTVEDMVFVLHATTGAN